MATRTLILLILSAFLIVAGNCGSSADKSGDSDYIYQLMSMQEAGKIDSTIMARELGNPDNDIKLLAIKTCGIVRDKRFNEILLTQAAGMI